MSNLKLKSAVFAVALAIIAGGGGGVNSAFAQTLTITHIPADNNVLAEFSGGIWVVVRSLGATMPGNCRTGVTARSYYTEYLRTGDSTSSPTASDTSPVTSGGTLAGTFTSPSSGAQYWCFGLIDPDAAMILTSQLLCLGICEDPPTGGVTTAAVSSAPGATVRLSAFAQLPADSSASAATFAWTCMTPTTTPAAAFTVADVVFDDNADEAVATFTAPMLTDDSAPPNTATEITVVCQVAISGPGGDAAGSPFMVTATIKRTGGGAAVNEAVLPNVLRGITNGINTGIFRRIQQRQRADGKWE